MYRGFLTKSKLLSIAINVNVIRKIAIKKLSCVDISTDSSQGIISILLYLLSLTFIFYNFFHVPGINKFEYS